jgi:hypothetical protein
LIIQPPHNINSKRGRNYGRQYRNQNRNPHGGGTHAVAFCRPGRVGFVPVRNVAHTSFLIPRIKAYYFPHGELSARGVRGIKTTQRGEFRSAPGARWVSFTADEYVDATCSSFCWDARMGSGLASVRVIDAYENGHGRLVLKKGPLKLKELLGREVDKGELQRYLAYVSYCPAMIDNNPFLQMESVGPDSLRIFDRSDDTGAAVDLDLAGNGQILVARAIRPMAVGKRAVMTPWRATTDAFREVEGMLIPHAMEASWDAPNGAFTYIRIQLSSVSVLSSRNCSPPVQENSMSKEDITYCGRRRDTTHFPP